MLIPKLLALGLLVVCLAPLAAAAPVTVPTGSMEETTTNANDAMLRNAETMNAFGTAVANEFASALQPPGGGSVNVPLSSVQTIAVAANTAGVALVSTNGAFLTAEMAIVGGVATTKFTEAGANAAEGASTAAVVAGAAAGVALAAEHAVCNTPGGLATEAGCRPGSVGSQAQTLMVQQADALTSAMGSTMGGLQQAATAGADALTRALGIAFPGA